MTINFSHICVEQISRKTKYFQSRVINILSLELASDRSWACLRTIVETEFEAIISAGHRQSALEAAQECRRNVMNLAEQRLGLNSNWHFIRKSLLNQLGDRGLIGFIQSTEGGLL